MRLKPMAISLVFLTACFSFIQAMGAPDVVVLRIGGKISNSNSKDKKTFEFTQSEFDKLPTIEIEAKSSHAQKKARFSGPRVTDALNRAGIKAGAREIIVTAMDGYRTRIPLSEIAKYEVILATKQDGKQLTLETKGPIWMMYPRDKHPELGTMATENRLVWSLVRIDVP